MNGAVHFVHAKRSARNAGLSVASVVGETYRLFWQHRRDLLCAMSLPAAFAGIILGATLQSYYSLLSGFLAAPSPRRAGIVFAILIAGALAWLFVAVLLASAGVTVAGDDHEPAGWWNVALGVAQARLFSAALRFVFILFSIVCVAAALVAGTDLLRSPGWIEGLINVAAVIAGVAVCVRGGFLLPALAARERHAVLRRSFNLSRGIFWRLTAVWVALVAAPAAILFGVGELVLGGWLTPDHLPTLGSAARVARELARDYAGIPAAILLTVITTICLTLAGIGSHVVYRELTA